MLEGVVLSPKETAEMEKHAKLIRAAWVQSRMTEMQQALTFLGNMYPLAGQIEAGKHPNLDVQYVEIFRIALNNLKKIKPTHSLLADERVLPALENALVVLESYAEKQKRANQYLV